MECWRSDSAGSRAGSCHPGVDASLQDDLPKGLVIEAALGSLGVQKNPGPETDSSASMNKGTCLLSICTESHAQESASFCVPTFRSAEVRSNTASINKLASFSKIFDFEEVALLFQALLLMGRWSELAAAFQLLLSGQQTPGEKRNSIAALSGQKMDKSCGSPASENAGRAPLKVPMHWGLAGPKLSAIDMYT